MTSRIFSVPNGLIFLISVILSVVVIRPGMWVSAGSLFAGSNSLAVGIANDGPHIVGTDDIEEFLNAHIEGSFLIPAEKQKWVVESLRTQWHPGRPLVLEVGEIVNGRQLNELRLEGATNFTWFRYAATEKKVIAIARADLSATSLPSIVILSVIIALVLKWLWRIASNSQLLYYRN